MYSDFVTQQAVSATFGIGQGMANAQKGLTAAVRMSNATVSFVPRAAVEGPAKQMLAPCLAKSENILTSTQRCTTTSAISRNF